MASDRVFHGALDRRNRSLMEHVFHSLHGGLANRQLRQVTFNQFDAVETMVEISPKPGAEIIHQSNLVTQLNQSIDQRRADEPGAPGHKKTCHGAPVARISCRMLNFDNSHRLPQLGPRVKRKNQHSGLGMQETALVSLKAGICPLELPAAIRNTVVINHTRLANLPPAIALSPHSSGCATHYDSRAR